MNHKITEEFFELNITNDLLPTIVIPTRVNHSTITLIDNIYFRNVKHVNYSSGAIISDISDHYPCLISIQQSISKTKSPKIGKSRRLDDKKIFDINNALLHHDWSHLNYMSVNYAYESFNNILSETIE